MADSAIQTMQIRERRNWLIHLLYIRQETQQCLKLIEEQLHECQGLSEYALFVKGLICRSNGELQESLALFQAATMISPRNLSNLKQVGRGLYLLGKHKAAIEVYEEARNYCDEDWELCHNIGLCYMYLKQYSEAEALFRKANLIQRHDGTYLQLGKLYTLQEQYEQAIEIYLEALEFSPENPEILTTVGLMYLRIGENFKAFDYLGNSLTLDPRDPKTILAAGSIIQDHQDFDVALSKYRVAAVQTPNSAQLWNNVAMCFFGKKNFIAAISCLKRALMLAPFEWIIAYNLGLVFLNTSQYASAFHYLSASINLKPDFASCYAYLALCLNRLDDYDNACSAYDKAISMESDYVFELNYAVMQYNHADFDSAKRHYQECIKLWDELDDEAKGQDKEAEKTKRLLGKYLGLA
jgi:Bardet-Biedl syndrome 4 protein